MKAITFIVILLLLIIAGLLILQRCEDGTSLTSIDNALAQRDENLAALQVKLEQIDSTIKQLKIERNEIKYYYTNKYYEIDSLANLDSLILYSIVRANTERLYGLQGFFSFAIRDTGAGENSKNPSGR